MSNKMKFLGIAPYEELNHAMFEIGKQFNEFEITIFTADLTEGQSLAENLSNDGYDAIISRGGTAKLIRKSVSIPVIDVSLSIYDILNSIRLAENYTKNFAIIGYPSITEKAHVLCNLLGYEVEIRTIDENINANDILDELAAKQYELILCDAITNRIALTKSLSTLLITSGIDSIKDAYLEAISISKHLNSAKEKNDILEQAIIHQMQKIIVFDEQFTIQFSSVEPKLTKNILKHLQLKKDFNKKTQFFNDSSTTFYSIHSEKMIINDKNFFSCLIKEHETPSINKNFDVTYQKIPDIENIVSRKLLFTKFIPDNIKLELNKYEKFYQTYLIFGETGTAKKNIAYQIYLNQKNNNNYLISINCKLMNEKTLKFLVNSSSSPFVDTQNTILLENIEQLTPLEIEKILSLIQTTKLTNHNNLIFIYDTNKSNNKEKLQSLTNSLNSALIYAPSIRERKNELSIITTLLINKMNIECAKEVIGFEPQALKAFLSYDWPGNLNQLEASIKDLVINANSRYISEHQVSELINREKLIQNFSSNELQSFTSKQNLQNPTLFDYIKEIVLNVLEQNNGNQTKTASQLGISRTTLWRYLKD